MRNQSHITRRYLPAIILAAPLSLPATAAAQTITQDQIIVPQSIHDGNAFGQAIAIDNNLLAVGAYADPAYPLESGAAYIFDTSTGLQISKLIPADGSFGDQFGYSIAIEDNIVAVGARFADPNGENSGAVYLFNATTGIQTAKLLPDDGAQGDRFGESIAIDNNIIVVGAPYKQRDGLMTGSAYLFDATTGSQLAMLHSDDSTPAGAFGHSVDIDNNMVAVGAPFNRTIWHNAGSVFFFDTSSHQELTDLKLIGQRDSYFGKSISLDNDIIAVGAPNAIAHTGATRVYNAQTSRRLYSISGRSFPDARSFGKSIALENNILAIGAYTSENLNRVTLFNATSGALLSTLLIEPDSAHALSGGPIAIEGSSVFTAGVHLNYDQWEQEIFTGSVYAYNNVCAADFTADGQLDLADINFFIKEYQAQTQFADQDMNGQWDYFDISLFIKSIAQGCN